MDASSVNTMNLPGVSVQSPGLGTAGTNLKEMATNCAPTQASALQERAYRSARPEARRVSGPGTSLDTRREPMEDREEKSRTTAPRLRNLPRARSASPPGEARRAAVYLDGGRCAAQPLG